MLGWPNVSSHFCRFNDVSHLRYAVVLFLRSPLTLHSAAYVQGRDAFRAAGTSANLGRYNFGFMWAAVACLFLATVFLCAGGAASSSSGKRNSRGRFGRRQKSTRSRGSFIDKETAVDGNGGIDGDRSSFIRDRA